MNGIETQVVIIGTGSYGISLGKRLLQSGYQVIYGSRNPNQQYLSESFNQSNKFKVKTVAEAWKSPVSIVFLAISAENYEHFVNEIKLIKSSGARVLVEISNQTNDEFSEVSNAKRLETLVFNSGLKEINIVKGFNLINAYSIGTDRFEQKSTLLDSAQTIIPICGNDLISKEKIRCLCSQIGYQTNDIGDLTQALRLERLNRSLFNDWFWPSVISLSFFVFNLIWIFIHYFMFPKKPKTWSNYLQEASILSHLNKCLGFTALQLLAWVYFGSILASLIQLKNGTKYKLFHSYVDTLLRNRKQYGLYALLFASCHAILTIFVVNPGYLKDWYVNTDLSEFTQMKLIGEMSIITGVFSYILFILVALSSINSIANSLNWKEWHFVQTKIGIACLLIGTIHTTVMYMNTFIERNNKNFSTVYLLTRVKLYASFFPFFVIALRFLFAYCPPIRKRIHEIKSGKYQNGIKSKKI